MRDYLARRWLIFLCILTGVYFVRNYPVQARQALQPVRIQWVSALTLFLMSLGLETRRLWAAVRQPGPALVALGLSAGVAPLGGYLAGQFFHDDYRLGLILVGCLPCTLASAAVWTRLAGGNDAVALLVTMLSNLLVCFVTTGWLALLTGQAVAIHWSSMALDLVFYAALPILLAQLLRNLPRIAAAADQLQRGLSILCLLLIAVIIFKATLDVQERLTEVGGEWSLPGLLAIALACLLLHLALLLLGFVVGRRWFVRPVAIAIAFAGSQKTLPVGAMLIAEYYPSVPLAIVPVLFYHVGQLLVDLIVAEQVYSRTPLADAEAAVEGRVDVFEQDPPAIT